MVKCAIDIQPIVSSLSIDVFPPLTLGKLELRFETSSKLHHESCLQLKILKVTLMQNDVLFLEIQEGVQASQKYEKPDEYNRSREQQHNGAKSEQQNMENLTGTSLENKITAALTGSKCS